MRVVSRSGGRGYRQIRHQPPAGKVYFAGKESQGEQPVRKRRYWPIYLVSGSLGLGLFAPTIVENRYPASMFAVEDAFISPSADHLWKRFKKYAGLDYDYRDTKDLSVAATALDAFVMKEQDLQKLRKQLDYIFERDLAPEDKKQLGLPLRRGLLKILDAPHKVSKYTASEDEENYLRSIVRLATGSGFFPGDVAQARQYLDGFISKASSYSALKNAAKLALARPIYLAPLDKGLFSEPDFGRAREAIKKAESLIDRNNYSAWAMLEDIALLWARIPSADAVAHADELLDEVVEGPGNNYLKFEVASLRMRGVGGLKPNPEKSLRILRELMDPEKAKARDPEGWQDFLYEKAKLILLGSDDPYSRIPDDFTWHPEAVNLAIGAFEHLDKKWPATDDKSQAAKKEIRDILRIRDLPSR